MLEHHVMTKPNGRQISPYLFVDPGHSVEFHAAMRQKGIIVERLRDDRYPNCFRIIHPLQGDTAALRIQWEEIEKWRRLGPQAVL